MKSIELDIDYPTLNEYIRQERTDKEWAAATKREFTELTWGLATEKNFGKVKTPTGVIFEWYRKDRRTDPDNVSFAKKFIFDGLERAKVIENDGPGVIAQTIDKYMYGCQKNKVVLKFYEMEKVMDRESKLHRFIFKDHKCPFCDKKD